MIEEEWVSISEKKRWLRSALDELIGDFPPNYIDIGPKDFQWKDRVKLEIQKIMKYVEFLKSRRNRPWFKLFPDKNPKYNYLVWTGHLTVPERPEIKFDIKVLLTSEYPKVCPRCFIDERIVDFCGKVFLKNIWEQNGRKYMMICHEHMAETEAWEETLGIVHFFVREIWIWWAAQQNAIIQEHDKRLKK